MVQKIRRRLLVAGALAAAGPMVAKSADAVQDGKLTIALVLKSLADPFSVAMASGAQNYQKHYASQFDLSVRGSTIRSTRRRRMPPAFPFLSSARTTAGAPQS